MNLNKFENTYHHYGVCPNCGEPCQPDYIGNPDIEYVVCCDCQITWTLYHEDPTDKRDDTENWRTYRIAELESFADAIVKPHECRDK